MSFYSDIAADAASLIQEFGTGAQLIRTGPTSYDTSTATVSAVTTTYQVTAFEAKSERSYIDGTLIQAGLEAYLLSPNSQAPQVGDVFVWFGSQKKVEKALPLAPAGVAVLYEIQVRQ